MTQKFNWAAIVGCCAALAACSAAHDGSEQSAATESTLVAGSNAAGSVPAALPSKMMVGLFENLGGTWLRDSGAKWDMRYAYFTNGWLNRWGYGPADGQSALDYMRECDSQGFIPVIQYYVLRQLAPVGDESQTYAKTTNAATMNNYWSQYKVLMQKAKEFGKPVVIILEGDGFGFLEMQTANNPNAYSAIAASGV